MSSRPLPTLPSAGGARSDLVWVPDRYVPVAGDPRPVHVPAHWELRRPDGRREAPPLVVPGPGGRGARLVPAGTREAAEVRSGP